MWGELTKCKINYIEVNICCTCTINCEHSLNELLAACKIIKCKV